MAEPIPVDEQGVLRRLNVSPNAFCVKSIMNRARWVVCGGSEHGAGSTIRVPFAGIKGDDFGQLIRTGCRSLYLCSPPEVVSVGTRVLSSIVHHARGLIFSLSCFVLRPYLCVPPALTRGQPGKRIEPCGQPRASGYDNGKSMNSNPSQRTISACHALRVIDEPPAASTGY